MTLGQLISNEYNGKKSIKKVVIDLLSFDKKFEIPIYDGHVYSAVKRSVPEYFHSEVMCFGRLSPRAPIVNIVVKN